MEIILTFFLYEKQIVLLANYIVNTMLYNSIRVFRLRLSFIPRQRGAEGSMTPYTCSSSRQSFPRIF